MGGVNDVLGQLARYCEDEQETELKVGGSFLSLLCPPPNVLPLTLYAIQVFAIRIVGFIGLNDKDLDLREVVAVLESQVLESSPDSSLAQLIDPPPQHTHRN